MTSVNEFPHHIFSLLDRTLGALRVDLETNFGIDNRGMRSSQLRLVSLTPPEGMRVTELAERARMTPQALGEFVRDIANKGLLEIVPDPTDGRARIVRPTAEGRVAAEEWGNAIAAMESAWRERVGTRRWDAMRRVLLDVVEAAQ